MLFKHRRVFSSSLLICLSPPSVLEELDQLSIRELESQPLTLLNRRERERKKEKAVLFQRIKNSPHTLSQSTWRQGRQKADRKEWKATQGFCHRSDGHV